MVAGVRTNKIMLYDKIQNLIILFHTSFVIYLLHFLMYYSSIDITAKHETERRFRLIEHNVPVSTYTVCGDALTVI